MKGSGVIEYSDYDIKGYKVRETQRCKGTERETERERERERERTLEDSEKGQTEINRE